MHLAFPRVRPLIVVITAVTAAGSPFLFFSRRTGPFGAAELLYGWVSGKLGAVENFIDSKTICFFVFFDTHLSEYYAYSSSEMHV